MTEPVSRIEAALARLGAEHEPPAGWEAKVLAQIERGSWWRRLLRWKIAMPIAVAATAAVVIVALLIPRERALTLALDYAKTDKILRSAARGAHVGGAMRAVATGGDGHRAVWVYHEDRLVVGCPGRSGCIATEDETVAELELKAGNYTVVALTSRSPISPPGGAYDRDVAGAEQAGATVKYAHVTVR
jgi:hypothetical protein